MDGHSDTIYLDYCDFFTGTKKETMGYATKLFNTFRQHTSKGMLKIRGRKCPLGLVGNLERNRGCMLRGETNSCLACSAPWHGRKLSLDLLQHGAQNDNNTSDMRSLNLYFNFMLCTQNTTTNISAPCFFYKTRCAHMNPKCALLLRECTLSEPKTRLPACSLEQCRKSS